MKNEWTKKMENVKPCPFCGSISISAKHKDCGIYLYNSFNKILKMKVFWQARGYNKAIDDFAGKLKTEYKNAVAEQLKLKHIEKESEE